MLNANTLHNITKPHDKLTHLRRNDPERAKARHSNNWQIVLKDPGHSQLD